MLLKDVPFKMMFNYGFFLKSFLYIYIQFIDDTYPSNPNLCTIVALNTGPIGRNTFLSLNASLNTQLKILMFYYFKIV